MLELICRIPESIGWVTVGVLGTLAILFAIKIVKTIVTAHINEEVEQ